MFRKVVACTALFAASLNVAALDISCPEKITTSQKLLKQASGWQEFVRPVEEGKTRQWSYVSGISLYTGNPKDIAQLKPDDEMAKDQSWSFSAPSSPERPLYMACAYFETRIQFVKALPLNVKKCTSIGEGVCAAKSSSPNYSVK